MTWAAADPPEWLDAPQRARRRGRRGAEYLVSLDREELISTARTSAGLDDFGGDTWRPHFDVLVDTLEHEGRLTLAGRIVARTELLRSLRQRLLLTATWAADPTILEEPIDGRCSWSARLARVRRSCTSSWPSTARVACRSHGNSSIPAKRSRTPRSARRAGHQVHSFWADLQPAYETMHHNHGDEPNECIFATMLEFLSDQWGGTYDIPTYSGYLVGADHTDAYRYHRKVLQTLQRRQRGDRWVLKAPSHLAQLRTLFAVYPDARVIQIHRDPLKTVPSTISLMGTLKSMHSADVDVTGLAPLVSMGYGFMLDDTIGARSVARCPMNSSSTFATTS